MKTDEFKKEKKKILDEDNTSQKNEANKVSDRRINFDTFGGCIDIYAGFGSFGRPILELGLNSSSRGSIYFDKKVDLNFNDESSREATVQVEKDRKEIIDALESLCEDFDNKIKNLLKKHGYELRESKTESSQKNESLDLSKLSSKDAEKLSKYFNDFAKDKTVRYDLIDKIEDILKNKYKTAK